MPKYTVTVRFGYTEKEFVFNNYPTVAELIRCMVIGSHDVEIRIRTEYIEESENKEEMNNGETDRRLP